MDIHASAYIHIHAHKHTHKHTQSEVATHTEAPFLGLTSPLNNTANKLLTFRINKSWDAEMFFCLSECVLQIDSVRIMWQLRHIDQAGTDVMYHRIKRIAVAPTRPKILHLNAKTSETSKQLNHICLLHIN